MDFKTYQNEAEKTVVYPKAQSTSYLLMGLAGEVGELLNKAKKVLRGDGEQALLDFKMNFSKEMGDILWYWAMLCTDQEHSCDLIAERNVAKLADRAARNQIKGSGDNR